MKDWSKRATLAEKEGGTDNQGFEAVGLVGTIPVVFEQDIRPKPAKKSLWRKLLRRPPSKKALEAAAAEAAEGPKTRQLETMAILNQPLGEVAAQAGQFITYKCKKGECGTCEVRIDGQWVRTCVTKTPFVAEGDKLEIHVRDSMTEINQSSKFFSLSSFKAGFMNNFYGMVGFVKSSAKGDKNFAVRMSAEEELKAKVAARKAAKAAEEK